MAILWIDNQARCGHKVAVAPALDVAEPYETVAVEGYNTLAAVDLCCDILGRTSGDTGAPLERRFVDLEIPVPLWSADS